MYGYGLEGFLTGEINPPPQMVPDPDEGSMVMNPAFVAWQRQDRRVAGWLLSSLSERALTLVVGLRSSRDIWRALETNFASRSTAKVMQYRQQLQNLKKDALTMSEYLSKMRTYFHLLGSEYLMENRSCTSWEDWVKNMTLQYVLLLQEQIHGVLGMSVLFC